MNKCITFEHLTGTIKPIPGVPDIDTSRRMQQRMITGDANANGVSYPVLVPVPNHKVTIVLLSEDYDEISDADKKLPAAIVRNLEDAAAKDLMERRDANKRVRDVLMVYERQGEIKIHGEAEMTPEELLVTTAPIVSLSEIAIADHLARGIDVPEHLQNKAVDTERLRAAATIAKTKPKK